MRGGFLLALTVIAGLRSWGLPVGTSTSSYWLAVDLAARGNLEEGLVRFATIPGRSKDDEVQRLTKLGRAAQRCGICQARVELSSTPVAQAALLHTEAAWQASQVSQERWEELRRARDLFDALRALPSGRSLALEWYRLVALVAHKHMDWELGEWVADEGLSRYPGDDQLLLTKGTLLETLGWRGPARHGEGGKACLERSRTALEGAMRAADPSRSFEARLRLAHVCWLLGQRREAQATLEALDTSASDATWQYLVWLFRGGILAEEGAHARSADAYRRALELQPEAQAAHVGLAHAFVMQGDVTNARTTLHGVLAAGSTQSPDPFWLYPWGRTDDAERQAGLLRLRAAECCH